MPGWSPELLEVEQLIAGGCVGLVVCFCQVVDSNLQRGSVASSNLFFVIHSLFPADKSVFIRPTLVSFLHPLLLMHLFL